MDDHDKKGAGHSEPASDLDEVAEQLAASNLLEIAGQLARLAEDLKALSARPIQQTSTSTQPSDKPEPSAE
ncbi:hypothetical protein CO661_11880 [Sinorhizobium fredii]|uniref:Uncharacterized protein n=1 Tax=Rhizobium fredii TaxID=380 RepID=A0A2A6LYL9_RHIFR|nr:hypothetical protein [Sinorhizobium fredii]PDT47437.1 hypothetical protein CO661_11880 [Sinorhizobium fredii]